MEYDEDKIDEVVFALLSLTAHDGDEYGCRVWKTYDWDVMNRLHEKQLIDNPVSKSKSVVMSAESLKKSQALFDKIFEKMGSGLHFNTKYCAAAHLASPRALRAASKSGSEPSGIRSDPRHQKKTPP
jgi:hypothetical protein